MIYAVQMPLPCGCPGPIKFGFATNVDTRIRALQVGSPYELTLLAVVEGDPVNEFEIHQQIANHRMRGEWFAPAPEVVALVQLMGNGVWKAAVEGTEARDEVAATERGLLAGIRKP